MRQKQTKRKVFKGKGKGKGRGKPLATRLKALEHKVKPMVENWKYIYFASAGIGAATLAAPIIQVLNGVPTGLTETNQRVGDLCKFHYLNLNLTINRIGAAAAGSVTYRVILVREYTALGSAPTCANIFNSNTPPPNDVRNVVTRNGKRFQIFYDTGVRVLGAQIVSTAVANVFNNNHTSEVNISIKKRFHFTTDYSRGVAGTVADIDTNSLSLIILTDDSVANDMNCYLCYSLSFLDA